MTPTRWARASDTLVATLARAADRLDVEKRLLFGYPCYFVNGNMFLGAHPDGAIVRLGREQRDAVLSSAGGFTPFEPRPGRVMKEYVVAPASMYENEAQFRALVLQSLEYARSLPEKEPRAPRAKRRGAGRWI